MTDSVLVKINFRGGIISPGKLYELLISAEESGVTKFSFGLRQQLLFYVAQINLDKLLRQLGKLSIHYETGSDEFPNIISSYPAEGIFINHTWLSEGVYKDIFDMMDHRPRLKINISDSNQSFTPLLTGNINWVAVPSQQHFWHLFIRFPKTNVIYEWTELVYTNDVARMSCTIEKIILENADQFVDNSLANGNALFDLVHQEKFITRTSSERATLPPFNLPYYEGLNRYHDKYWLGVYRRDELFDGKFLQAVCQLCLQNKIGQFCSTPWKAIIVKGIEEKDKPHWNNLLAAFRINMRHAANELNFQVEDHCSEGLALKNHLLKHLHHEDIRTFGICIGIKTRKKSEVFSSILIKRKPLINFAGIRLWFVYDILCARDFNPNERTGEIFSRNTPKVFLAEQLRRAVLSFYSHQKKGRTEKLSGSGPRQTSVEPVKSKEYVHQCKHCLSVYDPAFGDMEQSIPQGTSFDALPPAYTCSLCESPKADFRKVDRQELNYA